MGSSASGFYQFLEGSVPTAYNRAGVYYEPQQQQQLFGNINKNKDSSFGTEEIQDALFFANIFQSKGSDKYLGPALFLKDKTASRDAYLYNHHTLSSKKDAYNQATINRANKIWQIEN